MSLIVWKGPTNALVLQPNSPRLVYGDRVKAVDIYKGQQSLCAESMLARGTFGTGFRAGWVVNQCTCDTSRGDVGTLTIEWEAGGSEADQPLPAGDFSLEPQEIYPKVERNAFFSGICPDMIRATYNALYAVNQTGGGPNAQQIITTAANSANFANFSVTTANGQIELAYLLLDKLSNGEESFYMAGYRYSFSTYSYTAPALSEGGIIGTPDGPISGDLPNGVQWLRLADKIEPAGVNGSMFKLTENWIGGPGWILGQRSLRVKFMLRSGQPLNTQWTTVNRQGAQGDFHKGEIIASRDAIENRRARMLLGGGGMQLATPMEYDMTQAYPGQTWVHVGAGNDAATAGTIDPVSGLQVYSLPGWYCSAPGGVPIAGTEESPAYNIPQMPLPDVSNIDDATKNFWVIYSADAQCY